MSFFLNKFHPPIPPLDDGFPLWDEILLLLGDDGGWCDGEWCDGGCRVVLVGADVCGLLLSMGGLGGLLLVVLVCAGGTLFGGGMAAGCGGGCCVG